MPQTLYTTADGKTFNSEILRRALEDLSLVRAIRKCSALRVTLPAPVVLKS